MKALRFLWLDWKTSYPKAPLTLALDSMEKQK
jgi:hypothetical protein